MPFPGNDMETRNGAFQTLKPICVALSQAALTASTSKKDRSAIINGLEILQKSLTKLSSNDILDAKLADYAFFPLSQVLKQSNRLTIQCLELSLQCIAILVEQGWRQQIQLQLAAQIVILCTLMSERKPKGFAFDEGTDELQSAALKCMYHVFDAVGSSTQSKGFFTSEANFPQLGQTITVILGAISDAPSGETQAVATQALQTLTKVIMTREISASFLPGIVSKLTKILIPSTKQRRYHEVLIGCLRTLCSLLRKTLGDDPTNHAKGRPANAENDPITTEWKATAAKQLLPALSSIMHLRDHSRDDVKEALAKLCLTLLEYCCTTLANCSPLALETILTLCLPEDESPVRMQVELLIRANSTLAEVLQTTVYDWLQALPTTMQGSDEQIKMRRLDQICAAYELLRDSGTSSGMLDQVLVSSLRDSIIVILQAVRPKFGDAGSQVSTVQSMDLIVLDDAEGNAEFAQSLVKHKGQAAIISRIQTFVQAIGKSPSWAAFAADVARSLRLSDGETQIANFWLLLTATGSALHPDSSFNDFLNLNQDHNIAESDATLEELYGISLTILNSTSDLAEPTDPRLTSLALRTVALRGQQAGRDFRYELIDALYPVLHTLATPDETLQHDSITTLNILARACQYNSVRELVVENVDYLTNAVALKLNSFDVSPQAPQVLLMMVRLAGPSLLPFLEDAVESIFAVLESYHGYNLLVELLFRVLGMVAEEGAKAPALIGAGGNAVEISGIGEKGERGGIGTAALAEMLREKKDEEEKEMAAQPREGKEPHPQQAWKAAEKSEDDQDEDDEAEATTDDQIQPLDDIGPPPPAPKIYALLLKITSLTQHFLPSASPSLRTNLLSLIRTTVPAIAKHEDSFLPLINTLWPEIVSRLEDPEAHVQAASLEIVEVLCEYAGAFMRSRIVKLWPLLMQIYGRMARELVGGDRGLGTSSGKTRNWQDDAGAPSNTALTKAVARLQASPADYTNTSLRLLWNSLIEAIVACVSHATILPEMFDEALIMLGPVIERRDDVRGALENVNADAVWLLRVKSGAVVSSKMPVVPAGREWRFAATVG
ncbi:hypothetical protein LTR62_006169 [Meristemomyces frigidus]|uniref:Uncharacterized protein n=1 Tax=Meristemomyces frigidus TaxID=1508187 RepID=A0AAN7TEM2_9PEZI|nr:hypothetical protein LTR62_006169 [Meristemomyces frigidus]